MAGELYAPAFVTGFAMALGIVHGARIAPRRR